MRSGGVWAEGVGLTEGCELGQLALQMKQGGHHVPRADVLRRFVRGWDNFKTAYRPPADSGQSTIIQGTCPGCWSEHHEKNHESKSVVQRLFRRRGPRPAPRRQGGRPKALIIPYRRGH